MILIASLITGAYIALIIAFIVGFDLVSYFSLKTSESRNKFSIIIPFRNEAQVLPELIESLTELEYPKDFFEILFINDESSDDSAKIIEKFFSNTQNEVKVLNNRRKTNSPKKDAINTAIHEAKYNWIITTDADCIVSEKWLQTFDQFIQRYKSIMITAPVTYESNTGFLNQFQSLDLLSLIGSTIGGFGIQKPFLCNGANLCYSKEVFHKVNGFEGNEAIASGDDIFLLEKMVKKFPKKVHFLKSTSAVVTSKPQPNLKDLLQQRVRWAAKATHYKNGFGKLVSWSVFLINLLIVILFFTSIIGLNSWYLFIIIFILKVAVDFTLLYKTAHFFKLQRVLKSYLLSSFFYPVFSMFVAMASLTSSYQWKGRKFKK